MSIAVELKKLAELYEMGALSQEEFEREKAKLLGTKPSGQAESAPPDSPTDDGVAEPSGGGPNDTAVASGGEPESKAASATSSMSGRSTDEGDVASSDEPTVEASSPEVIESLSESSSAPPR
jgi:hypothetical protein